MKGPGMSKLKKAVFVALLLSVRAYLVTAQDVHPVVDVETGCLMGGVVGGKWLEAEALAPLIKGGERYRLYTLKGSAGEAVGEKVDPTGDPCGRSSNVAFSPKAEKGIAVDGRFNALPRVPLMMNTNDPRYREVVARLLRSHGIRRAVINITQLISIDLDGDGSQEVLISATHLAEGLGDGGGPMAVHARPGDYSVVFLRKIVRGRVRDIILSEDFHPRKVKYPSPPFQFRVAAVLDVNGDGQMEIILHGDYYEGGGSTLYRILGNRAKDVFGCDCGE